LTDWRPTDAALTRAMDVALVTASAFFRDRGLVGPGAVWEIVGWSAEDIAADALLDALVDFDPSRGEPTTSVDDRFLVFVWWRVRKRFLNLVRRTGTQAGRSFSKVDHDELANDFSADFDFEKFLLDSRHFIQLAADDKDCRSLVMVAILGIHDRQEIAVVLGWTVEQVDKVRKRMRRRRDKLEG
jgi:DNA-directed RNA polymerase specialized sigma24 family protein